MNKVDTYYIFLQIQILKSVICFFKINDIGIFNIIDDICIGNWF